ncbi:MAG: ribosomal protein S12 methylthiotransferase accessory factor, partial [Colwellia sp.]
MAVAKTKQITELLVQNFGNYSMEIKVNYLDNLRIEAKFDDFSVIADQPIRYKGDGSAPGPFDYFLASSALCAAYFV